ncbi:hypothetical protein BCR43DRAFT_498431 [Syncephalastrum racemosum]|uniref:Uncharacterized protein n=1 Tax=Syncephalastrum racemosum TaxID=13706 RepID=A0A1X2H0U5_SYNRA|nr:hypothetical protein BCR43DRAFT_498431 [Syncephalastrum racemosum]
MESVILYKEDHYKGKQRTDPFSFDREEGREGLSKGGVNLGAEDPMALLFYFYSFSSLADIACVGVLSWVERHEPT